MMAGPLVTQHALMAQFLFETHPEFAKAARAAGYPQLVPRKANKLVFDLSRMCTTGAFQGFRKLTHFPTVALAVSQSNKYVEGNLYDAPAGWYWATLTQVKALPAAGWCKKAATYYYNHGLEQ